jgi:polysaccharide export outer membrane protein
LRTPPSVEEKMFMQKFVIMGFIAALSAGCANSSAERFPAVSTEAEAQQSAVAAGSALSSANVHEPQSLAAPSITEDTAAVEMSARSTGSLQAFATDVASIGEPGIAGYKIGPRDVLDISVFKVPELSKSVQVSEAGTVNLPLLGEVYTANQTARDLEKDLTSRLGKKYLQEPQVSVFVKEYNSQRITVDGAVKRPGVFPVHGGISLLQAVAIAQGLEEISDDTVVVFRETSGKRQAARFDISDIRSGDADDPQLVAGDVVIAGTSNLKKGFNGFLKALPIAGMFALL